MAFDERAFCDVYIHQCVCSKIEGECKEILSKKTDISTKAFPFKFPIWVPSRDPPKLFKMNSFK